jgi:glycerophosphoryl diester phosphodiesterase
MHDTTVDRTTNLRGNVRDLRFAQLQAADAGDGEPVPSLAQVLELVAGRLTVMCELKATPRHADRDEALVGAVLDVLRERDARAWSAVHSFSPDVVARSRDADPGVSAAIISPAVRGAALQRLLSATLARNAQAVSLEHRCVDAGSVLAAKRRQLTVWAWTADRPADWERLVAAGVDGIITNVPHQLRAFLAR